MQIIWLLLLLLLLYKQSRVLHVVSIYSQDKKIKQSHEEKICVGMLAGFKKSKFGFCCCNIWFVLCGVECSRDGSVVVFLAGLELLAQRRLCLGGLLLLFLAARDGELEDVRELFVLGGFSDLTLGCNWCIPVIFRGPWGKMQMVNLN